LPVYYWADRLVWCVILYKAEGFMVMYFQVVDEGFATFLLFSGCGFGNYWWDQYWRIGNYHVWN
jgi:hypothetical protein